MDPFSPITLPLAGAAAAEGAINVVSGVTSNVIGTQNTIFTVIGNIFNQLFSMMTSMSFLQVIGFIIIIGKCIFLGISFVVQMVTWFFSIFIPWLFGPWHPEFLDPTFDCSEQTSGFIPWAIRYVIVIATQVSVLPKCFLWYFLDTLGWVIYLPFRFVFWLIDYIFKIDTVQKGEREVWKFLDSIDYFIHGPTSVKSFKKHYIPDKFNQLDPPAKDPDSMNLGFHFLHFPDSVMNTCYRITPYKLKKLKGFPMKAFQDFLACVMTPF